MLACTRLPCICVSVCVCGGLGEGSHTRIKFGSRSDHVRITFGSRSDHGRITLRITGFPKFRFKIHFYFIHVRPVIDIQFRFATVHSSVT